MAGVRLPDWWRYPRQCANGHEWGRGKVLVRWRLCLCTGKSGAEHQIVACTVPGCGSAWYALPCQAGGGAEGLRHRRSGREAPGVEVLLAANLADLPGAVVAPSSSCVQGAWLPAAGSDAGYWSPVVWPQMLSPSAVASCWYISS
jgi:hypothetical protein